MLIQTADKLFVSIFTCSKFICLKLWHVKPVTTLTTPCLRVVLGNDRCAWWHRHVYWYTWCTVAALAGAPWWIRTRPVISCILGLCLQQQDEVTISYLKKIYSTYFFSFFLFILAQKWRAETVLTFQTPNLYTVVDTT